MTDLDAERSVECRVPGDTPGLPGPREAPGPPSARSAGVELTRLLALTRLTPAQALEVAAGVLAAAASRSEADAGSADIGPVVIGDDGRVVLGGGLATDGRPDGQPSATSASAVAAVLADVAGAARLRARRADPAAEGLLAELDRAATDLPVAGVPAVDRVLSGAAAAIDREAARAELAALVRAIGGRAGPANGARPAGAASTAIGAAPARRVTTPGSRTVRRRTAAWLLSVLALAAVVLLEVAFLRGRITSDVGLLLSSGHSGSVPSAAAPSPATRSVAAPAPAAAAGVAGVDLRALTHCAPRTPCTVRLQVRLVPEAGPRVVTWSYRLVDRCTGASQTAAGGTVDVPAQGEQAVAVGVVPLPPEPAVAVFAVTQRPAAAASAPVLVGSCPTGRQAG